MDFIYIVLVALNIWIIVLFLKLCKNVKNINNILEDKNDIEPTYLDVSIELSAIIGIVSENTNKEKCIKLIRPLLISIANKCIWFEKNAPQNRVFIRNWKNSSEVISKQYEDIFKKNYSTTFMNHVGVHLTHISEMLGADLSMYSNYDYVRQFCPEAESAEKTR